MRETKALKIIGHRGARGLAPENTIASLQKGLDHNADAIEFDVRVTKDGVPILNHNPTIVFKNRRYYIRSLTFSALQEIKKDITTFEQALTYLKGKTTIMIEVKPGEPLENIVPVLAAAFEDGLQKKSVMLLSRKLKILKGFHAALPDVTLVVNDRWSGVRATSRARRFATKRINMNQIALWGGFIRIMHNNGYMLSAWAVNNPQKAESWHKKGLYGVITDFPDRMEKP